MKKLLLLAAVTALIALIPVASAATQTLDPYNCAAQGMRVGGAYECAPAGDGWIDPPDPEYPAHINQGGLDWYWYPESGWWYEYGGYLYPKEAA